MGSKKKDYVSNIAQPGSKGHRILLKHIFPMWMLLKNKKASEDSEVIDLVLPISLMLEFTSCANCYFSRSMLKSKFLNSLCLFVNRVNKNWQELYWKSPAGNLVWTHSACLCNNKTSLPSRKECIWNRTVFSALAHAQGTLTCGVKGIINAC